MIKKKKLFKGLLIVVFTLFFINLILKLQRMEFSVLYIVTFSCLIYLVWAFVYHKVDKSLTFSIYMEYVLTALLPLILLMGVLF